MKKKRFEGLNELKAGSVMTYINLIISTIIPLLYTPVMLRILGQSEYGLYSLSNSVISYLSLLNFGLGNAIIRYVTKYRVEENEEKVKSIIGLFLCVYGVLAGFVLIVGFALTSVSSEVFGHGLSVNEIVKLRQLLIIMTLSAAVSFPVSVYSTVAVAYEKYIFRKLIDCISTILLPILNLVVLFAGQGSVGMALVGSLMQIVYIIIFIQYCKRKLAIVPNFKNMPFHMLKEIGGFSAFVFLSSIVDMLYWATDKVLIGAMVGTVAVAVYNIGGTFTSMLQNMSAAISGVFAIRVNQIVLKNEPICKVTELLIRIGRLQYLVVSFILSGYIVFGQAFIELWAGEAYEQAYYIGLMTMIPLAIPLIENIAFATIVAQNKHQFRAIIYAVIAVINVISTYLVIPKYSIIGAAACTAIAFLVGNGLVMNIYYYKVTKLDIPLFWKNIMRMSVLPIVMIILSIWLLKSVIILDNIFKFGISVIIYSIIFLILTWYLTMNQYEHSLFCDMIKKITIKKKL